MAMDLQQLQNLAKRDPKSYKEDCLLQYHHFSTELQLFQIKVNANSKSFIEQISFFGHITPYFPNELSNFPNQILTLLEQNFLVLQPEIRLALVRSLIMLRNRNIISPITLLPLFFKLFQCHDKVLRSLLQSYIVQDIKNINSKHKDNKLNSTLQNFLYSVLENEDSRRNDDLNTEKGGNRLMAKYSLQVIIELYKKSIWNNAKTVNVISKACFSKDSKTLVTALQFFLGPPEIVDIEKKQSEIEEAKELMKKFSQKHSKKTRKRERRLEQATLRLAKVKKINKTENVNFPAINLLYDPQTFAEKLLGMLKHCRESFDVRLMIMNLISRVIAGHSLILFNFYTFILKYMQPHQKNVTYILAVCVQACHSLVPDDALSPVIRHLANNFITERSSPEVMTIGLNTVREISSRCPQSIDSTLLQDLVQYRNYKFKGVANAAKGLIALYRSIDPSMLAKRDRGKFDTTSRILLYGEQKTSIGVDGIELLEQDEKERQKLGLDVQTWRNPNKLVSKRKLQKSKNKNNDSNEQNDEIEEEGNENKHEKKRIKVEHYKNDQPSNEDNNDQESGFSSNDSGDENDQTNDSSDESLEEIDEDEWAEFEEIDENESDQDEDEENEKEKENENENENKEKELTKEEKEKIEQEKKQLHLDALRILTAEDFERIKYLKLKAEYEGASKNKKRLLNLVEPIENDKMIGDNNDNDNNNDNDSDSDKNENQDVINPSILLQGIKKKKLHALERLKQVQAHKEEKKQDRHSSKKGQRKGTSTTNREKAHKTQPLSLIKYSRKYRQKKSASLRDKLKARVKHISNTKSFSKKKKKGK
eukprot:TRINITY_DN850_c0_g4_i2.p1 TRINITY_DN850_c0_g4~~TRINITY_DN850_c0_g4_i2.p1  ORF type:complete len:820 (-),score=352.03 TRINITY_DN850_c0_g4_i2:134-2593(-)